MHRHRGLRTAALAVTTLLLAGCKYESGGASASASPPPSPPPTPTAYSITAAPQVSTSGSLTLERYADTTSAIGGNATSTRYTLAHQESTP